jgi:REP element-mobilizing transposase RayT
MTVSTLPNRRSLRLRNYDYAGNGAYFVTLCVHRRQPLFGRIVDGAVRLNDAGRVAHDEWLSIAQIRPGVTADIFVIMPNHMHGIIVIASSAILDSPCRRRSLLGDIVRGYKSAVTGRLRALSNTPELVVWQRNYHEHVIRNEASFTQIAEYIQTNPLKWVEDTYYVEQECCL